MKDERSRWEKWKDQTFIPFSRAVNGFGRAELNARGMKVELRKDTPKLKRRTLNRMMREAGVCVRTDLPSLSKDIIFVRIRMNLDNIEEG